MVIENYPIPRQIPICEGVIDEIGFLRAKTGLDGEHIVFNAGHTPYLLNGHSSAWSHAGSIYELVPTELSDSVIYGRLNNTVQAYYAVDVRELLSKPEFTQDPDAQILFINHLRQELGYAKSAITYDSFSIITRQLSTPSNPLVRMFLDPTSYDTDRTQFEAVQLFLDLCKAQDIDLQTLSHNPRYQNFEHTNFTGIYEELTDILQKGQEIIRRQREFLSNTTPERDTQAQ